MNYAAKVLRYAGDAPSIRIDPIPLITGSATWSFKSNCAQYEILRNFAAQCLKENRYPQKAAFLKECAEVTPIAPEELNSSKEP